MDIKYIIPVHWDITQQFQNQSWYAVSVGIKDKNKDLE